MKDMLLVACQDDTMAAFRSLFVDMQGNLDEAALTAAVAKVRSFSVDAASVMFKAVSILQDRLPNLTVRWRDRAHAIRIALQRPCQEEPRIAAFREKLFGTHGLVPDLRNSMEWKLRLRTMQAASNPNGPIFRAMDYSAIRFDSESEPTRRLCAMVLPIALLLAAQATDVRLGTDLQKRSASLLRSMSTSFIVTLGLYADLQASLTFFLRRFDVGWHDPALTGTEVEEFCQRPCCASKSVSKSGP